MSFFDDNENRIIYGGRPMRLAKQDITCRRCGVPAYWQETVGNDGQPKVRLFADGKPHVCHVATTDDFEDVSNA